jgi:pimeloyl-ACP methyl ester carboxylesterase
MTARRTDVFVLVHSPLVGPLTWSLVAEELRQREIDTVVPVLHDTESSEAPCWRQHVASVTQAVTSLPEDRALVLVGHSGAGPLLPAIGQSCGYRVGAYIFVDAALPLDGKSRLDGMEADDPEFAAQLRGCLAAGGRFPTWNAEDLRAVIPDDRLRQRMVAELRPRPLAFFQEPIPGFAHGPDAPCAYLQFSAPYARAAWHARRASWAYRELEAGHFHMLVDPAAVTNALLELLHL